MDHVPPPLSYYLLQVKVLCTPFCWSLSSPISWGTSLADCSGGKVHKIDPYMMVCMLLYNSQFLFVGVAWVHPRLIALEGEHKIDPYMVVRTLLYKGWFYVCWCGLGISLADCSGRRVHKIDPYMVVCMLLYKGRFYVLYIRLTLIV